MHTGQLTKDQGNRSTTLGYWQAPQQAEVDNQAKSSAKFESGAPLSQDVKQNDSVRGLSVDSMIIANKNRSVIDAYIEAKKK